MYRLLVITLVLGLASCSNTDDFTPTTPGGPIIPSIGGTYRAPDMWRFELTPTGAPINLTCAGGLTIGTQVGNDFSGTWFIADDNCGNAGGAVTAGTLQTNGAVSFGLELQGTDPNLLTALASALVRASCTYVSGDRVVTGTIVGSQLQANSRTSVDCGTAGPATFVLRLAGGR